MDNIINIIDDDIINDLEQTKQKNKIHIRIQQRNGRKSITSVEGLDPKLKHSEIAKYIKKKYCCNGNVDQDKKGNKVLRFQGDQRQHLLKFIINELEIPKEAIIIHGS